MTVQSIPLRGWILWVHALRLAFAGIQSEAAAGSTTLRQNQSFQAAVPAELVLPSGEAAAAAATIALRLISSVRRRHRKWSE